MGLRLPNQDQYVGADDGQAEVEQDDGSFRADVSVEQSQGASRGRVSVIDLREVKPNAAAWFAAFCPSERNYLHSTA